MALEASIIKDEGVLGTRKPVEMQGHAMFRERLFCFQILF
jgi:hypothetical protein